MRTLRATLLLLALLAGPAVYAALIEAPESGAAQPGLENSQKSGAIPDQKTLANGLYMEGTISYQYGGGTVSMSLDYIRNDSYYYTTGTLRLSIWATTTPPTSRGSGYSGYRLATFASFAPLLPRYYYYDIRRSAAALTPPNGTYWIVVALEEYDPAYCSAASGYCVQDTHTFSNQVTWGPPPVTKYPLSVTRFGTGSGTVVSAPIGINCGATCRSDIDQNTIVTLTATPSSGSSFAGWGGACTGLGPCSFAMTAGQSVSAQFNAIPPASQVSVMVTHYYTSILRRLPDAGGKAFWESEAQRMAANGVNVNEAWFAMAGSFFTSPEYLAQGRSNADYIRDLYVTFFNRVPDAGGLAFWSSQLASGMPREVALVSFMFSPEFASFTQAMFGNAAARAEVNAVVDFYRGMLSRLPDTGGLAYWVQQFRTAQCQGSPAVYAKAESISQLFMGSPEYAGRSRSNTQFVGDMYNAFLRRGGDLGGVLFWIVQLDSGARPRSQVRQDFLNSVEFSARIQAIVNQGCLP